MKVIYDDKRNVYGVLIEHPETEIWINTADIAIAREEFVERMKWLFNEAICEQLKDSF